MSGGNIEESMIKISIVCSSYNHERFVGKFIESVLSQTRPDWELIIVDDNSSDNNVREVEKYTDPRIRLVRHSWNMGINAGLNDGIELAKGEYIVFCASDDMLYPEHLETVSKILDERPQIGAVACLLTAVDENGHPSDYLQNWTKPPTEDRYWALRQMFLHGNFMLSPGMTVKRSLLKNLLPLPMSEVMIQDCALWTRIFLKADIAWTHIPVVYYRRMSDGSNVSVNNPETLLRCEWEASQLLDIYKNMSVEEVENVFKEEIKAMGLKVYPDTIPYILGRIALGSWKTSHRSWGYRMVVNYAKTPEDYIRLHDLYGFTYKDLLTLVKVQSNTNSSCQCINHKRKGLEKLFYKLYRHFEKRSLKKCEVL